MTRATNRIAAPPNPGRARRRIDRVARPLAVLASVALVTCAACVKSTPEPPQASATDAAIVAITSPAPSARLLPPALAGSALPPAFQSIAERFAYEAQHRPTETPRPEDVFAAFENSGTKLSEKRQHAAGVYGAQFCMGAKGEDDLHMSVCEFASEADLEVGKGLSDKMFGTVPDRVNYGRKKSLLILRQASKTPPSEARAKKLAYLFAKM
jgi:hypothetical protein